MFFIYLYIYMKGFLKECNNMNLEKLLAENMLRFGTKNVSTKHINPYLLEQTKVPPAIYNTYVIKNAKVDQLPAIAKTYDPTKGAIRIIDGNPWLATQRAKSLQQFLINRFQGRFEIPFDESAAKITQTAVLGPGNDNQYMKATIKAKLYKAPRTQSKYNYSILYNFYDIAGVPHIIVTKQGLFGGSSPKLNSRGENDQAAIKQFETFINRTKNSKLVKQSFSGRPDGSASETNYGILIPILGGYTAKDRSTLYFDNFEDFDSVRRYIAYYTDIAGTVGEEKLLDPKSTQSDFRKTQGGGGNYIFGDLGSGRSAKIIAGRDADTDVTIKRMESSKTGTLPGEILPGQEEKWWPISEILYRELFEDNLITIKPDMYKLIFDKIQEQIDELISNEYEIKEMTADIQGFASTDAENNRCPQGFKPDHTWGGALTADKWITK